MPDPDNPGAESLRWWEKLALVGLLFLLVAFGYLTLLRSAYYDTRMTDYGVYARAAWAIRTDANLYDITDDNGWHYVYPPTFAYLFLPFADPPSGASREGYIAYPVGVVVWYVISLLLVAYSAHTLAQVILPNDRRFSRRWWYARLIPFDVCIAGIGYTLSRGQANVLLVAVMTAGFAAAVRHQQIRSGFWFAAAVILKLFPGLLLMFPFVRREWRAFLGVAWGALLFLLLIPASYWGFERTIQENQKFLETVVLPALGAPAPEKLAKELHNMTAKPSQSFMAILHYHQYPSTHNRPHEPSKLTKRIHWALSGSMILSMFLVGMRLPRPMPAPVALLFLGALTLAMLLIVPMSHMHYYAIAHPAIAGIWLASLARRPGAVCGDPGTLAGLLAWCVLTTVPLMPGEFCTMLRFQGMATWSTFAVWLWTMILLHQARRPSRVPAV